MSDTQAEFRCSIQEKVVAAIADKLGKPASTIRLEDDLLADLGVDSLAMAELTVMVDQLAGCALPGDQLLDAVTVGDLVELISRHVHPD